MHTPLARPVHILSLGFEKRPLDWILALIDRETRPHTDVVLLPETCLGDEPIALENRRIDRFRALAKAKGSYLALSFFRKRADGARLNTALLIGRDGRDVGLYDKVFPYWSEYHLSPPCTPGDAVPVFDADFGKVGFAVCFDANFPEVFARLDDGGAELVLWPSAYSAGSSLQAHAINHNYYIVTASYTPDCMALDINGREIYYQVSGGVNISRLSLDLDRCVFHENFNLAGIERLLRDRAGEVEVELHQRREQWLTLRSLAPGISVRALAKAYGLEPLRDYKRRSRAQIDQMRGFCFAQAGIRA